MHNVHIVDQIKDLAQRTGYAACGITTTDPFSEFEQAVQDRIDRFPEAAHLYESMREQMDHRTVAPWANSMIVCVRRYGKYAIPKGLDAYFGRYYLFDKRQNLLCPDYCMPQTFESGLTQLGLRAQKGKVPYRWAGARAGVTRFGKNCFAYSSEYGSWIDIAVWFVDMPLPPDAPTLESACPDGCRACIDACPTQALVEPFVMRRDRCVAYLTYWAPHPIPANIWGQMGTWIYGCDVCQQVCPMNRNAWESLEVPEWLEKVADFLAPAALASMDMETYHTKVHSLFWYIGEDDLTRWHVNAARALECESRV